MKKILLMAVAACLMCSCENPILGDVAEGEEDAETETLGGKRFAFTVKGDFSSPVFAYGDDTGGETASRGMRAAEYMSADGQDMSDLWVFDFVDGECVQSVHQTPADDDWGVPVMRLAMGEHHVYFVASRGGSPVVDESANMITWGNPRDTFWKDYEVTVVSTSNGNRAVTLDRVATKLKITVSDEIPAGCADLVIEPEEWYYGLNYVTGEAGGSRGDARVVSVPASYVGTTGVLNVSLFGICRRNAWMTDVQLSARDGNGGTIGGAVIDDAPFERNRSTEYSGNLFTAAGSNVDVSLNDSWTSPYIGTW